MYALILGPAEGTLVLKSIKAVLKQFSVSLEAFMVKKQRQPPFELRNGHRPSWAVGVVQVQRGLYASTKVCFSEKMRRFDNILYDLFVQP